MVRGAIGMPKFELSKFTVTEHRSDEFNENYERLDWRMNCDGCRTLTVTEYTNGKQLCKECKNG